MLAASMLQYMASPSDRKDSTEAELLEDMLESKHIWTDETLCRAVEWASKYAKSPFILMDMDECAPSSRKTFWSFLEGVASRSERAPKVVLTSKRPDSLTEELQGFPEIHFVEYRTSKSPSKLESMTDSDYLDTIIHRFCPRNFGETRIRRSFERLANMSRPALHCIVDLLSNTTRWPEVVTYANLAQFCDILENVSYDSTTTTVLSQILTSAEDQSGMEWILGWLLCSYRPFEIGELATILCHAPARLEKRIQPSAHEVLTARAELEGMLTGIVRCRNNRIEISPNISSLMEGDDESIWSRLRRSAPEIILKFLLGYLSLPTTQNRLDELFHQYKERVELCGDIVSPALVPPEQGGLIFYAVKALPHHLHASIGSHIYSDTCVSLKDPNGALSAWSRVYWAMSNPFFRPLSGPFHSAWKTMLWAFSVGNFDFNGDKVTEEICSKEEAILPAMDRLVSHVRANEEDSAVHLAQQLVDHAAGSTQEPTIGWPLEILRTATWLNMHDLLALLMRNGANTNTNGSKLSPSLIYTASRLGYLPLVELFLR